MTTRIKGVVEISRGVLLSAVASVTRRKRLLLLCREDVTATHTPFLPSSGLTLSQQVSSTCSVTWSTAALLLAGVTLNPDFGLPYIHGPWALTDAREAGSPPAVVPTDTFSANSGRRELDLGGKLKARAEAAIRASRLVWTAAMISADYEIYYVAKSLKRWRFGGETNKTVARYEKLQHDLWYAQEEQGKLGVEAETASTPEARAAARERGQVWYAAVITAAKRLAEAEAAGLRAPMSDLHRRSAERIKKLCGRNGGVYVKLGQQLSQMDFVVPSEFIEVLRSMLDQAPRTAIEDVRQVIREELGEYPEAIWKSFEPEPIASASLAQVHRAVGWDGQELAIKVQHRGLRETCTGDVDAVSFVVAVVDRIFPKFSYKWLADEMQKNLPDELNFLREAENSRRCAAMFEGRDDICVPPVVRDQTTERVLTMHFEQGLRATDVEGMRKLGVSLPAVAGLISEAFCQQMFRHGNVHCDPHGANVLVRQHPRRGRASGRPQLVLLDHGLYRKLSDQFRVDHCRLWKAIVFKDIPGIKKYCQRMNSGDMYHLLAAMLSSRSWDDIQDRSSGMEGLHTKDIEAEKGMVRGYVQQYATEIAMLLSKVDRQLILLFKTNDCLRHIDRTLGAPINTFVIAAKTCIRVLREEDAKEAMARLGAGKHNRLVRMLLYVVFFIRGIPEALKVQAQLWAMSMQERMLERKARHQL